MVLAIQMEASKERTFETSFVRAIGKQKKKPNASTIRSTKATSPAHVANIGKRRKANMSTEVSTIPDAGKPKDNVFQLVSQAPGQVQIAKTRRKRKPRPRRGNVEQLALPGLRATDNDNA